MPVLRDAGQAGAVRIYDALAAALGHVDASDWRGALDAIHEQRGSWKATAEALGVDKRTVERWRFGYVDKKTGQRRQIAESTVKRSVVPKVRQALGNDRRAQVARVDWRKLQVKASLQIGNYPPRVESMAVGLYLSTDAIAGISAAYVSGDADRVQAAFDHALGADYTGTGDVSLGNVEGVDFG